MTQFDWRLVNYVRERLGLMVLMATPEMQAPLVHQETGVILDPLDLMETRVPLETRDPQESLESLAMVGPVVPLE